MWSTHSCVQRRDSSRRLLKMPESTSEIITVGKRRDESRRGTHECARHGVVALILGLAVVLSSCEPVAKAKAPVVPAAPQPQTPAVDRAPLVLSQTTAQIPATDPVPPEAIPPRPPLDTPAPETAEPAASPRRSAQTTNRDARPRPADPPPEPETIAPAPAPATGPRVVESTEDRAASRAKIEALQNDVRQKLTAAGSPANATAKNSLSRVQSFLRLSEQALKKGDLRQAQALAERAAALLRDYTRGH